MDAVLAESPAEEAGVVAGERLERIGKLRPPALLLSSNPACSQQHQSSPGHVKSAWKAHNLPDIQVTIHHALALRSKRGVFMKLYSVCILIISGWLLVWAAPVPACQERHQRAT